MTAEEKGDLRQTALEVLVACYPVPRQAPAVRRKVSRIVMFQVADAEVEAALEFLRESGLVTRQSNSLSAVNYWRATKDGVLMVERGGALENGE